MGQSQSMEVAKRLGHPVIDGDGHWIESVPIFLEYLDAEAGPALVDRYRASTLALDQWCALSPEQRMSRRSQRAGWWAFPANTLDRATVTFPSLMYERLGEFGIDFGVVYTTLGQGTSHDDELRPLACRALNRMNRDFFAPYSDRLTPAAHIPMQTPQEAIGVLEHAVGELGMKVIMQAPVMRRLETAPARRYLDTLGLDSPYDYEPYWTRCAELGVSPTDHSAGMWPDRQSVSNFVFNHLGHFAAAKHASARGIFLGGVATRHPTLRFAFLEGGVGWAVNLLTDLVGHFEKRNPDSMAAHLRPTNIDLEQFGVLFEKYAPKVMRGKMDDVIGSLDCRYPFHDVVELTARETESVDDFAATGVSSVTELQDLFRSRFYFGCEADDPMTGLAFDPRFNGLLKPFFSSDIGHWDVSDMSDVLHEAWELVEDGLLDEQQFREFTFVNSVEFHTSANPRFFEGTAIEKDVARLISSRAVPESAA